MTAQEAAKLRQDIVALQRALIRAEMNNRELDARVKKLEAERGELDRPARAA